MRAAVLERQNPTWLRKCLMILFLGRHNFVQFSNALSLRHMADEHGTDKRIAQKLSRVARVHFHRQRKVMTALYCLTVKRCSMRCLSLSRLKSHR